MLQRVYGTSWSTQKELDDYLNRIEEAEKEITEKLVKKWIYFISEKKVRICILVSKRMEFISKTHFIYENEARNCRISGNKYSEILDRSLWEKSGHWENLVPICIPLLHLMKKFLLLSQ